MFLSFAPAGTCGLIKLEALHVTYLVWLLIQQVKDQSNENKIN